MTIAEAAARLGLSPATLRVQLRNGKIRGRKAGRDWNVSPAEVERYRAESLGKRRHAAASMDARSDASR